MATKPETTFKKKIRPLLDSIPESWWVKISQVALRGTPDFLGCIQGKFVALELKKDSKAKVTKLQEHTLKKIRHTGGFAEVVYPENWSKIYSELLKLVIVAPDVEEKTFH